VLGVALRLGPAVLALASGLGVAACTDGSEEDNPVTTTQPTWEVETTIPSPTPGPTAVPEVG